MLSPKTIETVKATAPVLVEHGETLTRHFYRRMFEGDPQVRAFFNPAHQHVGAQQRALAGAICAYAQNIDNLGALGPAVELIAQKHVSLNVKAEHYPIVGKHLLASIKEVLGDAATDDIINAWAEAYGFLADILIGREGEIYQQHRDDHGWEGFRKFVVDRIQPESDSITSFYLKPSDARPLPNYLPGQYITVRVDHPTTPTSPRNYSLSDRAGEPHFRISVKREEKLTADAPAGLISSHLHDAIEEGHHVEVGPPCGEFTINPEHSDGQPVVLIAGGIGVTPLLSMAKSIVHANPDAPVYFLQAARNSDVHAFADEIQTLASLSSNMHVKVLYDAPLDGDVENNKCDGVGYVNTELLRDWTPFAEADFYFCGPKPFMQHIHACLQELGVNETRVRYEFFGPKEELQPT